MSATVEMTFETAMARLQEIVDALEGGELTLENSLALYKEGLACSQFCREKLTQARHELEVWQEGEAAAQTSLEGDD